MKLFSNFRNYISSTHSVLVNFPKLTVANHYQIQYTFDLSTTFCQTTKWLHEPDTSTFDGVQHADLPTLMILHGATGGIDSARWHALALSQYQSPLSRDRPYRILSISRPGYLSSQPICHSFSDEAYILDQICHHLNLKQVAIMAVSSSGPTALSFVRDYPNRIKGLILMDAIAKHVSFSLFSKYASLTLFGLNITSNMFSYIWHRYWKPKQMVRLGFSGQDAVDEIYTDDSIKSLYRDYHLRTFTWGGYRRQGFRAELEHLKHDLKEHPDWKVHVPVMYLYGAQDPWITDEHIECVFKTIKDNIPRTVVKYPQGKHILPSKDSSQHVNEFLWKHIF